MDHWREHNKGSHYLLANLVYHKDKGSSSKKMVTSKILNLRLSIMVFQLHAVSKKIPCHKKSYTIRTIMTCQI